MLIMLEGTKLSSDEATQVNDDMMYFSVKTGRVCLPGPEDKKSCPGWICQHNCEGVGG